MDKGSVTPPSGLGVVGLDAHSTVLTEQFEQIISRHIGREFDADEDQRREPAAMVDNLIFHVFLRSIFHFSKGQKSSNR